MRAEANRNIQCARCIYNVANTNLLIAEEGVEGGGTTGTRRVRAYPDIGGTELHRWTFGFV